MTLTTAFWRRLCYVLAIALALTALRLHVQIGYPKEWDRVQIGMNATEVWSICGPPTGTNAGMKPDHWEVPFLWGTWNMQVNCGDTYGGKPDVVSLVQVYYEGLPPGKTWIRSCFADGRIVDFEAFERAFGFQAPPESAPKPPGGAQGKE